ncbi:hypothetical protein DFH09DRAFT_1325605 [Mycena vulgaris]|nr:hypothetical protein DFH09DRAFT_1325605 [Mycena vulgaris]
MAPELERFYLDIPLDIASSLCLHPVKYLRFLGYCIFGVDGTIAEDDFDGHAVPDADPLGEGVYYFVREGVCLGLDALEHAVDPEAMTYSHVSEITNKRDNFRTSVAERDVCCTFTNGDDESSQAIHIVPVSEGGAMAVLKTPNCVLACDDIPPRRNTLMTLLGNIKYSTNPRYTLQ